MEWAGVRSLRREPFADVLNALHSELGILRATNRDHFRKVIAGGEQLTHPALDAGLPDVLPLVEVGHPRGNRIDRRLVRFGTIEGLLILHLRELVEQYEQVATDKGGVVCACAHHDCFAEVSF
jgi:hypothetical protein